MAIPSERRPATGPVTRVLVASTLCAGLGTAAGLGASAGTLLAVSVATAGLFAVLVVLGRITRRTRLVPAAALLLAAAGAGLLNGAAARPASGREVPESDQVTLTGVVREVQYLHWGNRLVLDLTEVSGRPSTLRARLTLPGDAPRLRPGDVVSGSARLGPPASPANPGAVDLVTSLRRQGIDLVGRGTGLARTASGPPSLARRLDIGREQVRAAASRAAARVGGEDEPEPRARLEGVLRAISLGEAGAVPPAVREAFATAGLAHLLAVSGLHIGLVAAGLFALLRWLLLRLPGARRAGPMAAVLVAPTVGLLVSWVGHPPSAARAGFMAVILLGAAALRRRLCGWSSLSLAALGLMALQPSLALRPGFQLSFAAVAGLLLMVGRGKSSELGPKGRLREKLGQMGVVTLAAALATAPLCAIHFSMVPLLGNLANLLAVPLTGLLVPLVACAAATTLAAGGLAEPLWTACALVTRLLLAIAEGAAALPLSSVPAHAPGPIALGASLLGLWLSARARGPAKRAAAAVLVLFPLALSGITDRRSPPEAPLEVVFLAVGHGDAALIRTERKDILVDAGRGPLSGIDAGSFHIVPALRALGVRGLDAVIVTHPHYDHYGGLPAIMESMKVDRLFHTGLGAGEEGPYNDMLALAEEMGVETFIACADPLPDLRPVLIECLHPRAGPGPHSYHPKLSANDNSVVVMVTLGEVGFLLPGDIEEEGEARLLLEGAPLSATVVKAPHHGSDTSSTRDFVAATRPEHVVYSTGEPGARFDFPSPSIVERWSEAGAGGWWTHLHGAVHFATDGRLLEVRPFRESVPSWPPAGLPAVSAPPPQARR